MKRNVYLQGELGEKFGSKFVVNADTHQEILKCIDANRPDFRGFLLDCKDKDIGFSIEYQDTLVEESNLLIPLKEGDVTISIVPAGSKSGIGKILAAVFLVFVVLPMIGAGAFVGPGMTTMEGIAAAMGTMGGQMVAMLAVNLAITGVGQLMAPDPSLDSDAPENYSFNGNAQNIKAGDPIPILYGELRVPGRPISLNITNGTSYYSGTIIDGVGNVTTISQGDNNGRSYNESRGR